MSREFYLPSPHPILLQTNPSGKQGRDGLFLNTREDKVGTRVSFVQNSREFHVMSFEFREKYSLFREIRVSR